MRNHMHIYERRKTMKFYHKWNGLVPCCSFNLDYISQTNGRLKHGLDEHCRNGKKEDACDSFMTTHLLPLFIFYNHYLYFTKTCTASSVSFTYLNFHGAFYISINSNNLSDDFFSVSSLMPENYFFLVWIVFINFLDKKLN